MHPASAPRRRHRRTFIKAFIEQPRVVGAIAPSSVHLARRMVSRIDFTTINSIAEFGPGLGAFTDVILERLRPGTTYFAIEKSRHMAAVIRERHPGITLYEDSASNIVALAAKHGIPPGGLDCIVSGLPFTSFSDDLQKEILDAATAALKPGGQFVTFAYNVSLFMPAAWKFRALLRQSFSSVHIGEYVWRNLPPAFIYRCAK